MTAKDLREAREAAGLSMAEATRLTGEKYRTWQSWEDDGPNGRPPRAIAFSWLKIYAELKRIDFAQTVSVLDDPRSVGALAVIRASRKRELRSNRLLRIHVERDMERRGITERKSPASEARPECIYLVMAQPSNGDEIMNLKELKKAVDSAIERAKEYGERPEEVAVTLQIDVGAKEPVWSAEDVELHYDGNLDASGCVLTAYVDAP